MHLGDADLNERGQVQPGIGRLVNEQVKKKIDCLMRDVMFKWKTHVWMNAHHTQADVPHGQSMLIAA